MVEKLEKKVLFKGDIRIFFLFMFHIIKLDENH